MSIYNPLDKTQTPNILHSFSMKIAKKKGRPAFVFLYFSFLASLTGCHWFKGQQRKPGITEAYCFKGIDFSLLFHPTLQLLRKTYYFAVFIQGPIGPRGDTGPAGLPGPPVSSTYRNGVH